MRIFILVAGKMSIFFSSSFYLAVFLSFLKVCHGTHTINFPNHRNNAA